MLPKWRLGERCNSPGCSNDIQRFLLWVPWKRGDEQEVMWAHAIPLLFSQLSLIWSDVKSQIGPSSLPPVYITELIKERMVIKKWWNGRGLWQEKLILFNKKDGGWGEKELQKESYWGKEGRQWGSKIQSCCIYYSLSRMACTNTEHSTEALDLGI